MLRVLQRVFFENKELQGFVLALVGGVLLAMACTTLAPKGKPIRTHYTLRLGTPETNPPPLPNYIPIFIDWHLSDGKKESFLGFRGWDFDRDGRINLLEVLDESSGTVKSFVVDFNNDGIIELAKKITEEKK